VFTFLLLVEALKKFSFRIPEGLGQVACEKIVVEAADQEATIQRMGGASFPLENIQHLYDQSTKDRATCQLTAGHSV
jgi:hypothetical protein